MATKNLVAFFSASGVTKGVAECLAKATGSKLFEIKPVQPYSTADLDWTNKRSRSTLEMKDPSSRPEIVGMPNDLAAYDLVFIGFPIWWYTAPTIIKTFLEAGDFSGKEIALFATSGGSGMGKTESDLKPCAPDAAWMGGKVLPSSSSVSDLANWVSGLHL